MNLVPLLLCFLLLYYAGCHSQAHAPVPAVDRLHEGAYCVAIGDTQTVINAKTGDSKDVEYWSVECEYRKDGEVKEHKILVLPQDATYQDAMLAIDEYRKLHHAE